MNPLAFVIIITALLRDTLGDTQQCPFTHVMGLPLHLISHCRPYMLPRSVPEDWGTLPEQNMGVQGTAAEQRGRGHTIPSVSV